MNQVDVTDINEAIQLIETYKLSCLVWAFEDCPLDEIKSYVPRGKEELVVVSHKNLNYLSFRLINSDEPYDADIEDRRITFDFHPAYFVHIILGMEKQENPE